MGVGDRLAIARRRQRLAIHDGDDRRDVVAAPVLVRAGDRVIAGRRGRFTAQQRRELGVLDLVRQPIATQQQPVAAAQRQPPERDV